MVNTPGAPPPERRATEARVRLLAGTPEEKSRGAFYTPAAIADYLARWAIRKPADRILKPSCGEAAFLSAAAQRLNEVAKCGRAVSPVVV